MADKPARALVIYGDGLMSALGPSHSHLHALASKGCCGFLALRDLPSKVNEDERVVRELAQLLDVHDLCFKEVAEPCVDAFGYASGDCNEHVIIPAISERFMGMKAAMVTNSGIASAFGEKLGFSVIALHELRNQKGISEESEEPPDPLSAASELLSLLGLQEAAVAENSKFDLVFVHIVPTQKGNEARNCDNNSTPGNGLEWINALVGRIMETIQPGTAAASHLYLALVLSYGAVSSVKMDDSSLLMSLEEISPSLASLCPHQSYTMKEGKLLDHVRHHHPMLVVQQQEAVTRRDGAKRFSFEEFQEHGGNLAILADRFLYEIAFKLWKTPKYGA
eukprot:Gb_13267 [translate_table: standard]